MFQAGITGTFGQKEGRKKGRKSK